MYCPICVYAYTHMSIYCFILKNTQNLVFIYTYTVGFYGGKSRENHLFRLYFLKISFCNLFKVVYHRLIPHLVKITTLNVAFYTPSKNTIRMGGKFLNLHSLIFSLLLFYTQKTAPKSY
jgi:hypothetical protein